MALKSVQRIVDNARNRWALRNQRLAEARGSSYSIEALEPRLLLSAEAASAALLLQQQGEPDSGIVEFHTLDKIVFSEGSGGAGDGAASTVAAAAGEPFYSAAGATA